MLKDDKVLRALAWAQKSAIVSILAGDWVIGRQKRRQGEIVYPKLAHWEDIQIHTDKLDTKLSYFQVNKGADQTDLSRPRTALSLRITKRVRCS